ncbi:MAG: methyltransferase family protein [Blastocatellia bacterium]
MSSQNSKSPESGRTAWRQDLTSLIYFAIAFACLVRWGSPSPLSRVNLYTGGFFALTFLWLLHLRKMNRMAMWSEESKTEFTGVEYDPDAKTRLGRLFDLWPLVDLIMIFVYAHWRLFPALERESLQAAGLILYVLDLAFVIWIDSYLIGFFACERPDRQIITDGPYRYIRHPRYSAILTYRVIYALVFASVIGWAMVAIWLVAVTRRIKVEEDHMKNLFGTGYETYALKTTRLVPRVY